MKQVSLQELKTQLSKLVEEAAAGERILITRYKRPIAELGAPSTTGLRVGENYGRGLPGPLFRNATRGRYLELLEEDRREGPV